MSQLIRQLQVDIDLAALSGAIVIESSGISSSLDSDLYTLVSGDILSASGACIIESSGIASSLDSDLYTLVSGDIAAAVSGIAPGASGSINGLSDVDTTTDPPANNEVLKWNGSNWVPAVYNASFTFSIASFSDTGGSTTVEIGTGEWKAIGAVSFSATYNNGPATSGYVTQGAWASLILAGAGFEGPTVSTESVDYPSVGSSRTFTLHATDGETSPTNNNTYVFYNYRYWGVDSNTSLNEAQIEALAGSELSNNNNKTFTVTAAAGEYLYYCYPTRLGTSSFTVGGFEGGFEAPDTVSVTNSKSFTEDYYVYRSTNSGLGETTVVVT